MEFWTFVAFSPTEFQESTMLDIPEPRQTDNSFGFVAWRGNSSRMSEAHAHNDIEVNFSAAPVIYDSGGRTSVIPAGIPAAFWGAQPHQLVEMDPATPFAFATVPLARFLSWSVPPNVKARLLQGEILHGPSNGDYSGLEASFHRWAYDLYLPGHLGQHAAELEIQGLLVRLSLGDWSEAMPEHGKSSVNMQRAAKMALFIKENSGLPVRATDVAAAIHLHPNRAASIFSEVFGVGINAYLRQHRVAHAQRLLLTTDLPTAAVSARAGFQSLSSFHETFSAVCHMSPGTWRRQHLGIERKFELHQ
ncbi:helix-turn-helix domain-containing protein [Paenarthrobacter sp. OM7]|uniref:helix-turn-helix domain-containing protein n=1 Tax=Paenarthrobacter sp. OM7 TaxID=3041264 RepID=UPI00246849A8|nr:helix-turn-helix domain-containing protein [Paenarthrobacter sp. OM7]WGM18628.1 helix-turn-helix domain-containing protein [Paenarthrobacter sp. OM7]